MLRVTVELFPRGFVRNSQILSQVDIINDGSGSQELGNYRIESEYFPVAYVKRHSRDKHVLSLVGKALQKLMKTYQDNG